MFSQLYNIAREEDTIKKAVTQIRSLCDLLEVSDPIEHIKRKISKKKEKPE